MTGVGGGSHSATAPADPFSAAPATSSGGASGGEGDGLRNFLAQAGVVFGEGSTLAYDGAGIFVTQTPRNLERIRNILNRYNDVRQVEIEAKFMDVQEGVLEELGVNWQGRSNSGRLSVGSLDMNEKLSTAFKLSGGGSSGKIKNKDYITPLNPEGVEPIESGVPIIPGIVSLGENAKDLVSLVGAAIGNFNIDAQIRALSQKKGVDLMSAPKVTVLSGNPANIVVAQELRYPQSYGETRSEVGSSSGNGSSGAGVTITAGTPQDFTVRNVGVELKVTPTVEEDDYSISLDLNPKVTEFEGFVEYGGQSVAISSGTTVTVPSGVFQPIFSVREITSKVTVWDGATIVMGGLTREEVKKVSDKVPILGDIPFIGRAFQSKGETSSKRNLLVFVTANLVSPGGSLKKHSLKSVQPNSMFQHPTVTSPSGSEPRVRASEEK
jgi:general secretion pathway protein D